MSKTNETPPADPEVLASLLRLFADPTRLRIYQILIEGVGHNSEIASILGLAPNLVSYHLRALHEAGMIESHKEREDARQISYHPVREALEAFRAAFMSTFDPGSIQARQDGGGKAPAPGRELSR